LEINFNRKISRYVGLTEGSKCICSASAQNMPYTEQIDSSRCNSACSGNKDETCGGGSEVDWFWLKSPCKKGAALHAG